MVTRVIKEPLMPQLMSSPGVLVKLPRRCQEGRKGFRCSESTQGYHEQILRSTGGLVEEEFSKKEEFNIAEEMFLHDHNKCIEERKAALNDFDLNLVFPGYDEEEQWKLSEGLLVVDFDSFRCYPEQTELPMSSVSDILGSSSWSISPPSSPLNHDASIDSDFLGIPISRICFESISSISSGLPLVLVFGS